MIMRRRDHPGAYVRSRHIDFAKANWSLLCTLAYAGFIEKGRGMVVVNEADFINEPRAVLAKIRITFLTAQEMSDGKAIGEQEEGWMKEYQPEKTILLGFLRTDNGFSSYRLHGFGDNAPKAIQERGNTIDPNGPHSKS